MAGPPLLLPFMSERPAKVFMKEWAYVCGSSAQEKHFHIRVSAS